AWNLGCQDRQQFAVTIPGGQWLIENARTFLIFGPDGKMRVEQRRPLPPQHLQSSATAALAWLVVKSALGSCHTAIVEQLRGHCRGQPPRDIPFTNPPATHLPCFTPADQPTQICPFHKTPPCH